MHDPRRPRPLKPRTLSVLVLDANNFSRGLIAEILRSLSVSNIHSARSEDVAVNFLIERPIDLILLSWEEGDAVDGPKFVREMRRMGDERLRRLPIVLITAGLTRQMVINGRDAGVDEFLAKPISPLALRQRLEMVIETPRPFIDCSVYLGPCRRRKNPADYHGAKRRDNDRQVEAAPMVDQDELAAKTPIRLALAALRAACGQLGNGEASTLGDAMAHVAAAKAIAIADKDHALNSAIASFESYVSVASAMRQVEAHVLETALGALEQLSVLPVNYTDARDSVAIALGKAIQKKLAA
jgi:CheY-like chemotaxis protein